MKYLNKFLGTTFVLTTGFYLLPQLAANAVTLANGVVAFIQPPRLVSVSTPTNYVAYPHPTYYLTVEVPANAGEPLKKLTIRQRSGTENIQFESNDTFAFIGTRERQGQNLTVKTAQSDGEKNITTVTFDTPVAPGETVTIGLSPNSNPFYDGVYLFDITAFPQGEQTSGQSLGVGRLDFFTGTSDS